jgi:hypothetical protein
MALTRRGLLKGVGSTTAALATAPIAWVSPARANPALIIVAASIQAISSFMSRPDALGPYLQAIDQKLDLVVDQLRRVQLALAAIAEGIAALGAEIPEFLVDEDERRRVQDLDGLAGTWLRHKLRDLKDFEALPPQVRQLLYSQVAQIEPLIYSLSSSSYGARPQPAVATPLALAIHMNVTAVLNLGPLKPALEPHFAWYEKILDPNLARSLAWWRKTYADGRETLISRISSLQLARDSGFDASSLSSSHPGMAWMCHNQVGSPIGGWPAGAESSDGRPVLSLEYRPLFPRSRLVWPDNLNPEKMAKTALPLYRQFQEFFIWRFRSLAPDGYPILGLDSSQTQFHDRVTRPANLKFSFNSQIMPTRFVNNVTPPTACHVTPEIGSKSPTTSTEFGALLAEKNLLLERDGDRPGLIPQLNDLDAKIWMANSINDIVLSTRQAANRLKEEVG